jgi:disulfide bond formation protein DsbB
MPAYIDTFNQVVSIGSIILQVVFVVFAISLGFFRKRTNPVLVFFKQYGFIVGFLIAFGSMALSLFYSNVIGFPPCELCWVQRIFLYPQVLLFGMELYKKDKTMLDHSMALAICGALVSMYHVYIEHGGSSALGCATGGADTISCATRYVYEFGYVSIPVMALTASLFIILLVVNYKYMSRG